MHDLACFSRFSRDETNFDDFRDERKDLLDGVIRDPAGGWALKWLVAFYS